MRFSIFLVYSKSWTQTDINNIGYKTRRGSALTNYYRRSAMTSNCDYFRLTASQLLLTCMNNLGSTGGIGAIPECDRHAAGVSTSQL